MSVTPDESAPSRVPRDRFESFIEPPIVGIGVSVTGDSFAPYDFEAAGELRPGTLHAILRDLAVTLDALRRR